MRIGYACITMGLPSANYRTTTLQYASKDLITEITAHNLDVLAQSIAYNNENKIRLFRISSDIVPFATGPIEPIPWQEIFSEKLHAVGKMIRDTKMRVSMHPGQYTVLNSPDEDVAWRAVADLTYHTQFLDSLDLDRSHKIILHVGGVYQNKPEAIQRFMDRYKNLDVSIKDRLVIENDERNYDITDVLSISDICAIPVVFDNLHHKINPPKNDMKDDQEWIDLCATSWKECDGEQKIHYSQQAQEKRCGAHSDTILIDDFLDYMTKTARNNLDVMLEVKDKDLSAIKCIHCTNDSVAINMIETMWAKYKYTVLAHSQQHYNQIRNLLKQKNNCLALPFYRCVEEALLLPLKASSVLNASQHIWGYFKNNASETEKKRFLSLTQNDLSETSNQKKLKRFLQRLAEQYKIKYLLESYYFIIH